jgi:hypothetical protein
MPIVLQWIGVALTILGLAMNGTKELSNIKQQYQQTNTRQANESEAKRFMYATVNLAYDVSTGKHWFQHPDGQWKEYPPKPF